MTVVKRLSKEARGGPRGRPESLSVDADEAREVAYHFRGMSRWPNETGDIEGEIRLGNVKFMGIPLKVSE